MSDYRRQDWMYNVLLWGAAESKSSTVRIPFIVRDLGKLDQYVSDPVL